MGKKLIDLDKLEKLSKALDSRANAAIKAETQRALAAEQNLQTSINGKAPSGHTHDDRYYTESEINTKVTSLQAEIDADVKVEADRAKAAENTLQANIDKKANASHGNHVPTTQTANNSVFLRNDNTWATVTPANIGASATGHTHDGRYYTETEIDSKITTINTAISTAQTNAQKYADNKIAALVDSAPDAMNTLNELAEAISDHQDVYDAYVEEVSSKLAGKSDTGHTHNYAGSSSAGGAANSANKVNKNLAIKLNGGTTEGTDLFTFNGSAAKTVNITPSSIGAATSSHGTHVTYASAAPLANGTAAVGSSSKVAREDHVHPLQTTISGNAGSATKLATGRDITIGNKTQNFNGTENITFTLGEIGASASGHTHDDRYYTESEINTKVSNLQAEIDADVKVEADRAKAAENTLQANIDKKANASHGNHVPKTQTASNKVFLRNDNTWATVTPANIGAAASVHSHDDLYYTETEIDSKVTTLNGLIDGKANKSHGNHVPATQTANNAVFLRNDNTWQTVTPDNIGAAKASHGTHVSYATVAPKANGTAAIGSSGKVAREDHVHPLQTEVSGNAGSADVLSAPRNITIGNQTNAFDGSENITYTLSAIGASAEGHNHDGRYYTESEINTKVSSLQAEIDSDVKVEADRAKAAENALQANIDKKSDSSHTHTNFAIKLNGGTTEGTNLFTYNGGTAKTVNITPSGIGASATGHTHDDRYFTETEINSKITTINNSIATAKSDAQKYADDQIAALVGSAPEALNTLQELSKAITDHEDIYDAYVVEMDSKLAGKSDTGHTHNYAGSSSAGGAATSANKVNQSITIKLNGGTTEGTNLFTFNGSAAKSLNITPDSIGAAKSSHGTHVTYASAAPLANAETAAVGSSSKVAREDHVHPIQTTVSGNAGSADKWSTGRTITIGKTGKTVDGSANVSWTLSEIGAAAASHGTHLTLGTGSGNAYYGDKGKVAYDHSQAAHAPSNAQKNSDITKAEIEARLIGTITSHNHTTLQEESLASKTLSLNDLTLSDGATHIKHYYCPNDGSGSNITGRPNDSSKQAFNLKVELVRWSSSTDYITKQTYTQGSTKQMHVRYCTSGTWSNWEKVYTSAQKPTLSELGAAASSHGTHVTYASAAPLANGTAAVGSSSKVAREDHVHPIQTTVSGNAGTASKWASAITLTIGNKGKSVDGSGNVSWTLAEIGAAESGHTHKYAGSSSAGGAANSVANSVKVQLNGGTTEGTSQFTFNGSAAKTINITPSSIGAAKASHGTHVDYATATPKANGTAAVGSSSKVAREDHVHPLQTSVSGNAGTATKLKTARTITVNGIVSGSASFDGSDNVTITTTANDITSIEKSLTVGTDWMDTGISGSNLATGTYAVQMHADTQGTGGLWSEYFSGIMSWYSANTNSTEADEIALHKAGHASNGQHIYLRTKRNTNGVLVLQIAAKTAITTAIKFKFKFKKLI